MALESTDEKLLCPKCCGPATVFYSTKTERREAWTCPRCRSKGYWILEKAMILE